MKTTKTRFSVVSLIALLAELAVAWLKWQLFEDTSANARGLFAGEDCALCTDARWRIGKRNLR